MAAPDTERQYFAGQALEGILASGRVTEVSERAADKIAKWAWLLADKMIDHEPDPRP